MAMPQRSSEGNENWWDDMIDVYEYKLSKAEKDALHLWEKENVKGDGVKATSDWPGWSKYLSLPPWKEPCLSCGKPADEGHSLTGECASNAASQ